MFMTVLANIIAFFQAIPFTGPTWFVLFTLGFFIWLFAKASKDKKSPVNWEDLIIDASTNRTSPYKVGYIVGLIVSTWIVVRASDIGSITLDIFGAYLTFLLGGAVNNSWAKRPVLNNDNDDQPQPQIQPQIQPQQAPPIIDDDEIPTPPRTSRKKQLPA